MAQPGPKLTQARQELEDGAFAEPGRATLADVWRDYARLNPDHLRHRTMRTRASHWKSPIAPVIGHVRLRSFIAAHVYDVLQRAREDELADNTVRDVFSYFKNILQYAVDVNLIVVNPHSASSRHPVATSATSRSALQRTSSSSTTLSPSIATGSS